MPARELPARPSLEQYRKQAKELLKHFKTGDASAVARVREHHPKHRELGTLSPRAFALADAQWVLAREHGFDSWPKLVAHLAGFPDGDTAARPLTVQLPITKGEVNLCVFLNDGTRALTAVAGDPVRLWDVATGICVRTFDTYSVHAWAVRPVDDGRFVVIGCRDGAVRVASEADDPVHTLLSHDAMVRCVDVSHDLNRAISGAAKQDLVLRVWDVKAERCIQTLEGHRDGIYTVAFDGHQRRALSGSRDTTVRVWDLATGHCLHVLGGHTYHVHAVAWAADGRRALSCSRDIRLWDVETGRCLRVFEGHTETIRSVMWSADQRHALSAAHDRTVRVWDVESGKCLQVLEGHSTGAIIAAWSLDGRSVFSCDWNGEIRRWRL